MAEKIEAFVKPAMLVWARESAHMDIEMAAKKANVKPDSLALWERGEARPTIIQLRKVGKIYKRPIAVFYLPEPPKEYQVIRDFRRLRGDDVASQSPELAFEIRHANARREIALELIAALGEEPAEFTLAASMADDAEVLSAKIRAFLGIGIDTQAIWKPGYDSFNAWRAAFENAGMLVFQASSVPLEEMRGFSISDMPLPVIVVNIKDAINGRIFTLFHELAHILLREGGICDLYDDAGIEVFCNGVAGAALIPRESLVSEDVVASKSGDVHWNDHEIGAIANKYGVSREVALRRILGIGRTTEDFYGIKRKQFQEEYSSLANKKRGGPVRQYRKVLSRNGYSFARLVLQNYYQDYITAGDVSEFLDVRLKHLPDIDAAVFQPS